MEKGAPKAATSFSCPKCKKTNFVSFGALRDHFTAKEHPFRCGTCDRDFKTVEAVLQHFQRHTASVPSVASVPPVPSVPSVQPSLTKASKGTQTDQPNKVKPGYASQIERDLQVIQAIQAAQGSKTKKAAKAQAQKSGNIPPAKMEPIKTKPTPRPKENAKDAEVLPADVGPCETNPVLLCPPEQETLYRRLIGKCHGGSRLYAHGFTVPWNIKSTKKQNSKGSVSTQDFIELPDASEDIAPGTKKHAIVIDCEMVEVAGGRREVAFLTALDFLTGDILINHYVQPRSKVTGWNSRYSGITSRALNQAMRTGKGLHWDEARARLCSLANNETVLIGHALNNDLDVLGIIHLNIVDSCILTCEAVYPDWSFDKSLPRTWGLKSLTKELLGYDIQTSKLGHSALEDAYATREVVIWCITNPKELQEWARKTRQLEDARQVEIARKREEERQKKLAEAKKRREEAQKKEEARKHKEEAKKREEEEAKARSEYLPRPVVIPNFVPIPRPVQVPVQAPVEAGEKIDENWSDIGDEFVPLL
ncbi:hypothetical protein N7478_001784 [Penicillium angulare]|uniref:uncharacterized protein n=1 Tax=Penicillium angulare TaxID=116970 RepID=UPI00253F772A|nr:uncharacterized protein N7478_001784 [Penicillium angulare]KAJ5288754.1 hypothetical protein N7478_001784 [Penicillium angulare]